MKKYTEEELKLANKASIFIYGYPLDKTLEPQVMVSKTATGESVDDVMQMLIEFGRDMKDEPAEPNL